jgi:thiol-disulfide isomerase/thioredoxin
LTRRALIALVAAVASGACVTAAAPKLGVNLLASPAPEPIESGAPALKTLLNGKVALVDLWASWCEPCKKGIPRLKKLSKHYRDAGLIVIGINVGEERDIAGSFCENAGIEYPVYLDQDFALSDAIGERNVPALLLIDRAGKVIHRATEIDANLLDRIERALNTP